MKLVFFKKKWKQLDPLIDLSYYLVEQGFVWHYQRYSDDESLNDAEEHARYLQKGIWGDSTAIAPWIWRKNKRLKIN